MGLAIRAAGHSEFETARCCAGWTQPDVQGVGRRQVCSSHTPRWLGWRPFVGCGIWTVARCRRRIAPASDAIQMRRYYAPTVRSTRRKRSIY